MQFLPELAISTLVMHNSQQYVQCVLFMDGASNVHVKYGIVLLYGLDGNLHPKPLVDTSLNVSRPEHFLCAYN